MIFNADAKDKLGTLGSTADDISGAEGRAHAFALVTDILIGGAILAGGISFVLTVTAKSEPLPSPAARLVVGPGSRGRGRDVLASLRDSCTVPFICCLVAS